MVLEKKAIHSFEDLDVYKLAREFSRKVNLLIKKLPDEEEYNLKSQMRRAKLSVTNNIAEGFGRYHYSPRGIRSSETDILQRFQSLKLQVQSESLCYSTG
jgi:hypothetical protein